MQLPQVTTRQPGMRSPVTAGAPGGPVTSRAMYPDASAPRDRLPSLTGARFVAVRSANSIAAELPGRTATCFVTPTTSPFRSYSAVKR